ncbi:type-F conjugative transfer system secretin TraK [Vibrio chagasii]|uniref:Type-F conjugative transfer system secretin TraK n=1 Tax=Vibrio chagasii TaxID=170679 RepID=A0A7Y4DUI8_9VIBR|nr:type-F conjugative transfer system secretin TraK [Vibrio chagasii]NOH36427.1 type-F conjugative transfer system secretin TraK [Vibrio chagasii]
MTKLFIVLLSTLFIVQPALANKDNVPKASFTFNDGDTIPIQLSSININRLIVKSDKIANMTCPRGFCTTTGNQKDKTGSISVKINIALPFTAHITTTKGRLFALFITPKATPAIVTEFVSSQRYSDEKSVFQRNFDYPTAIAAFSKSMMQWRSTKGPISGFSIHHVDPETLPKDKSSLPVTTQVIFVGKDYSGIIYVVTNRSSKTITLTTAQFYSYAARSAALDKFDLKPNESTHLYVVTGGGANDIR